MARTRSWLRCLGVASAMVAALAVTRSARADATAKLAYSRAPGAETCADEAALRQEVAVRLGYDPFRPFASTTLTVRVMREATGFRGRVVLADERGVERGARDLAAKGEDCSALTSSLALTMSLAIDPVAALRAPVAPAPVAPEPESPRPPPVAPDPEPPAAPPPPPPAAEAAPKPPPRPARRVGLGLAGLLAVGIAPSATAGVRLGAELADPRWSFGLEGRLDLPARGEPLLEGGRVRSGLVAGAFVPCLRASSFGLCGVVLAGRAHTESVEVASPRSDAFVFAAAGLRAAVDLEAVPGLVLRASAEALGHLTPYELVLNGRTAFALSPVSGTFGVGAVRFF